MTLEQAKAVKPLNVVIKVAIGKDETIPAYVTKIINYTAPDGTNRVIASVVDSITKDSVTGQKPTIYKSYKKLEADYMRLKSQNPKILDIVEV